MRFKRAKVPPDMVYGTIHKTNGSGLLMVISYIDSKSVFIEMLRTGYFTESTSSHVRAGKIKDPLMPRVCGVGYAGLGGHKASLNRKNTKSYEVWISMIKRCYSKRAKIAHPSYTGCYVCDEWYNFQMFAEWFESNYIEDFQLDKDIKLDGNKLYSPETCMFVSRQDNMDKAKAKDYKFKNPKGEIVNIHNLSRFCAENNLGVSGMTAVSTGVKSSYKGWVIHKD